VEFLKRFEMPAKNPSEDAQRRWREAVGTLVKNRRRRFRMVPNLDKSSQVETQHRKIQVRRRRHQSHLILSVLLSYDFSTGRLK
jgi:Ca2+-transporting ATPase